MSKRVLIRLLVGAAVWLPCSCTTDRAQWTLRPYRETQSYTLDYREQGISGKRLLAPVLYQAGSEWYIAALDCPSAEAGTKQASLAYHRITPKLAGLMLRPQGKTFISAKDLHKEIERAGGAWIKALPSGARAVKAPYLMATNRTVYWKEESSRLKKVPVSKYPQLAVDYSMDGLCTVVNYTVGGAIILATSPIWGPLVLFSEMTHQPQEVFYDDVETSAP